MMRDTVLVVDVSHDVGCVFIRAVTSYFAQGVFHTVLDVGDGGM